MQAKKTAILILNYNNYEDTINCIESVEQYNTTPVKYIVVDNGSKREGTVDAIDGFLLRTFGERYRKVADGEDLGILPYVTFVVSQSNDGYARGNNKGLRLAYADDEIDRVLVLNNDVLFVEDIIGRLIAYQNKLLDCAIISPILYKKGLECYDLNCARLNHTEWEIILTNLFNYKNIFGFMSRSAKRRYLLLGERLHDNRVLDVELPSGSCMLFAKSLMDEIDIFDSNTFLYYEENILFKQVSRIGKINYVATDLKCIHLGASSTSKSSSSFVAKAGMKSTDYYLHHYCSLTLPQRLVWNVAKFLQKLKLNTIRR